MYLSKLTLHGFKSFAQKTELHYDPGVTAVVGPNGCGKSNIVDAVRWVTGEQRARILRSEKMDNVIFNGTARRRPLGMAEVTLTIQNTRGILPTEYSEVTIGRRLYRSGESEYLLNGVQCRLKDILDLFMDTGMGPGAYSVIELKMIEDILSENPQERRRLFEEAAGITKYKLRRTQALRKLDSTQANLTRLRDLTEEIGKRVQSLKRQAEKAAKAKEIETDLHEKELQLAQVELNRLRGIEAKLKKETEKIQNELSTHTAQQSKEEAQLEALRKELIDKEKELAERQQKLNDHLEQVRTLEADKRLAVERTDSARRSLTRAEKEVMETEERIKELKLDSENLRSDIVGAEPMLEKAKQKAEEARLESEAAASTSREAWDTLQEARGLEAAAEAETNTHRRNQDRLQNRIELLDIELGQVQTQSVQYDTNSEETESQIADLATDVDEARQAVADAEKALRDAEEEHESLQDRLEKSSDSLRQIERQHDAVAAEVHLLESLISSYDELSDAVKFLVENPEWTKDELQTVADVIGCSNAYQHALSSALDSFASCVVVKSNKEALHAIKMLREEDQGQTNIIVLDRLGERPASKGIIEEVVEMGAQPLMDVVKLSNKSYKKLADALLHNCYLVDSLDQAETIIEKFGDSGLLTAGPARFFAITGEWMDPRGFIRGGSARKGDVPQMSRMQRREQLEQAQATLANLQAALANKEKETNKLRESLAAVPVVQCRQTYEATSKKLAEHEREHDRIFHKNEVRVQQRNEIESRLSHLVASLESSREELGLLDAPLAKTEKKLTKLKKDREKKEEAFRAAEASSRNALGKYNEINLDAVQAANSLDTLTRELDRNRQDIAQLTRQQESRKEHIGSLNESIDENLALRDQLEQQISELYAFRTGLDKEVDEAEQARQLTLENTRNLENELRSIRHSREENMRLETQRAVRLAEVQTRADELLKNIEEDFERSLEEKPVEIAEGFSVGETKDAVRRLRAQLRGLGSINALALESYEEEKERFEFMSTQQQDLEKAEDTLLETISEINKTASERFDATFQEVRANFSKLFATLFGKDDSADLMLQDPEDPLESPIEIIAKPKGKRPSAITQLSGGEKTLTATALLFAIYLVKPSPFCILDEVDAPLDEANVERFMQLIREFASQTQFIMVTHNRRTMELADRLYGVTMQEEGVSKLVGVKFDEAEEMAVA